MKKMILGLLITAMALPTAPAMAQGDGNWANRQRQEDSRANHGRNRDHMDERDSGNWGDNHDRWSRRDRGRHRGWGHDRGNDYRLGRGQQMGYNDWNNSQRVDYRRYHLRQPPRGYEWRRRDDRFILAAVGTGLIMSVILSSGR
jgi:Ni/Co efflux regulator RcnB